MKDKDKTGPKNRTNGVPFREGPDPRRNMQGRPAVPTEIKDLQKFNRAAVSILMDQLMGLPLSELRVRYDEPDCPAFESLVIAVIMGAISKKGEPFRFNVLMDRLVGKATQPIEINPDRGVVVEQWLVDAVKMTPEERKKFVKRFRHNGKTEPKISE